MKTLYIIGNGFDIAHGLNTSYWNFREFLAENHQEFLQMFEEQYSITSIDLLDERISENARKEWENHIKRELWSEFENKMGQPNIPEMLDFSESLLSGMNLDSGLTQIEDTMDSYWEKEYGYIREFERYVKEWIESVDTEDVQPRRRDLIESTDYFLNFNYTDLLESVYEIDDILHIHGGVYSVASTEPIMGHCNDRGIEEHLGWAKESEEKFDEGDASIHRAVANYLRSIYKDTRNIIRSNQMFWDKLKDVNEVIIIGWSAGSADMPYLRKVKESVRENTKWLVYYYDNRAISALKKAMSDEEIEERYEVRYIPIGEFWD